MIMSTISGSSAAFYQYFRDREAAATPQHSGVGQSPSKSPEAVAVDQISAALPTSDATAAPSGALTPAQVRDRLEALIAGQVATGKLTDVQATELRRSLGPDTSPASADPRAVASPASPDERPPGDQVRVSEPEGSYKPAEVLATFIQNLQSVQARGASYGSTGAAPAGRTASRLLDFNT